MAAYSNINTSKHQTLVASTVDTITFLLPEPQVVEVTNLDATSNIYARTDGINPVVQADDTILVRAGDSVLLSGAVQVRLISSGTPEYHVERVA